MYHAEVCVLRSAEVLRILELSPAVGPKSPDEQRVAAKGSSQGVAIPVPQLHSSADAIGAAAGELVQNHREGVVEPDRGVGARPNDVARLAVIPIHHPGISAGGLGYAITEYVGRTLDPVGLPEK